MHMKTILFPTDFSSAADGAFAYALEMARTLEAAITVLHVYYQPNLVGAILPNTLQEMYEDIELEEFENYRNEVPHLRRIAKARGRTDIDIKYVMHRGEEAVTSILRFAATEQPDMIVLGTKGASGLRELFVGSVAAEVLENAEVPVLVVPGGAVFDGRLDRIACGVAFDEYAQGAVRLCHQLARALRAELLVFNTNTSHTEGLSHRMELFREATQDLDGITYHTVTGTSFEGATLGFLRAQAVDLFAMVSKRRGWWQELFHYNKLKQFAYHGKTPILVLHAESLVGT